MLTRRRSESGAVAIMMAAVAVVLFVIAALVVDLGLARDTKRQSQTAADASALAGGNRLYTANGTVQFATAVAEAKNYAQLNFGVAASSWDTCTDPGKLAFVPASSTQCISFDSSSEPTRIRVRIPTNTLRTTLGSLAGVSSIPVATAARVQLDPPPLPCFVCVLGSGQTHDLQNGDVTVDGGNVHFNGSVQVNTNGFVVTNGAITVEGAAIPNPQTNFTPDATVGQPAIPDPLGYLILPPDMTGLSVRTNPCNSPSTGGGPGIYGAHNFPNALCTLTPGLYVIAGGSSTQWALGGNSSSVLAGNGVTLYFTCGTTAAPTPCSSAGQSGATLDATGNGSLALTPPLSGPLQGVTIAFDRHNTSMLRLAGNGMAGTSGAIYHAGGKLQTNGNGCVQSHSAIVVKTIEMNGSPACLSVKSDPNTTPRPPRTLLRLDQ